MENVYSMKDNKIEAFGRPMFFMNEELCIANIRIAVCDLDRQVKNPVDYDLYLLGTFSSDTGKFETLEAPKHILNCKSLAVKEKEFDVTEKYPDHVIEPTEEEKQSLIEPDNGNPLTKVRN